MQDKVELEIAFEKGQQQLLDKFRVRMYKVAEETLYGLYTDVINHACTDAHTNYHNFLRDEFKASFIKEITTEHGTYSWAHDIRMKMLKDHPAVLQNKIIEDLQERVKQLEGNLEELRGRYRY